MGGFLAGKRNAQHVRVFPEDRRSKSRGKSQSIVAGYTPYFFAETREKWELDLFPLLV